MIKRVAIGLIRLYRYLASPWVGNQCRFYPTCSHYAEEAFEKHGALKAFVLTIVRLAKCHPWHEGGFDPVPEHSHQKSSNSEISQNGIH